jgi:hypothetical protein
MLQDLHSYLNMNIYFTDDEFRKQGELLVDIPVTTGQETVQGAASSLRFDLLKKHLSADPIAMRLLYSIITRMESLIGWKRFECNVLPSFNGITAAAASWRTAAARTSRRMALGRNTVVLHQRVYYSLCGRIY